MTEVYDIELKDGRHIVDEYYVPKMAYIISQRPEKRRSDSTGYEWDEKGLAQLFSDCYKEEVRYCPEAKAWYTYADGFWQRDVQGLIAMEKLKDFNRLMSLYCIEIDDKTTRDNYFKFISKMGDTRFRERVLKDARGVYPVYLKQFDAHPNLINCLNGTFDLDTFNFRPQAWEDFLTMRTNFEYTQAANFDTIHMQDLSDARWIQFIDEVTQGDKVKARYLQIALGYSMLGSSKEECMFILHGKTTRNGKSTLLSAIHHLLGDYAKVVPVSIICRPDRARNADSASPTLAGLKGKRFVTMAESNQYGKLDEEIIKQLTGGEEISARALYEMPSSYLPQFTLWLSCNDLPAVTDKSLFSSDRLRVIEFNRHFSAAERDTTLKDYFRTPQAMRGIFYWLVEGYMLYLKNGLDMPASLKKVVDAYEKDNDLVLQFLDENCTKAPGEKIRAKALYDRFKLWCKSNGYFVQSAKKFNAGMNLHPEWFDNITVSKGYQAYVGLKFKNEE